MAIYMIFLCLFPYECSSLLWNCDHLKLAVIRLFVSHHICYFPAFFFVIFSCHFVAANCSVRLSYELNIFNEVTIFFSYNKSTNNTFQLVFWAITRARNRLSGYIKTQICCGVHHNWWINIFFCWVDHFKMLSPGRKRISSWQIFYFLFCEVSQDPSFLSSTVLLYLPTCTFSNCLFSISAFWKMQ